MVLGWFEVVPRGMCTAWDNKPQWEAALQAAGVPLQLTAPDGSVPNPEHVRFAIVWNPPTGYLNQARRHAPPCIFTHNAVTVSQPCCSALGRRWCRWLAAGTINSAQRHATGMSQSKTKHMSSHCCLVCLSFALWIPSWPSAWPCGRCGV